MELVVQNAARLEITAEERKGQGKMADGAVFVLNHEVPVSRRPIVNCE